MSIHSLKAEIAKAVAEISDFITPYKPVLAKLVNKRDATSEALANLYDVIIKKIVDDFKAGATEDKIDRLEELQIQVKATQDSIKKELTDWIGKAGANASAQIKEATDKQKLALDAMNNSTAYQIAKQDPHSLAIMNDYQKFLTEKLIAQLRHET